MIIKRRDLFALSAGATAMILGIPKAMALAPSEATQAAMDEFTGGTAPTEGTITLNAPEIAENGNTVPIDISVDSPMTDDNYVTEVAIFADGNPTPKVATFKFSTMSGKADASTRIRLAKTQDVIAVAKMSDGTSYMTSKSVKVTIGGCGG